MSSKQEFKNDHLTIAMEKEPGCTVKLDITISPEATQASYRKAIKSVNKEVSLPGFRKGKAPDAIIEQNYAKYVDQEWRDLLVKTAFKEALDLTGQYPLNENSVKRPQLKKASNEEGSHVLFEMEVMPDIPEIDLKALILETAPKKEITQEDVDNAIMDLRLHHSDWEEITDRAVKEGDYVELDIDNIDDPENPICKDTQFEVVKDKIGTWLRKLIVGKQIGDVVEGVSKQEGKKKSKDFKPTNCRVTIKKIKHPKLPELDDEFSTKLGLTTVDELKVRVEQDLNKQAEEAVRENLRDQAERKIAEMYPFDIPSSIFEGEKKSRLSRYHELKQKLSEEEFAKIADRYTEENLNAEVSHSLRLYFLTRALANQHHIDVTQEEIVQEMMQHIYNPNSRFIDPSMETNEIRSKLYLAVLDRKTKDFIIDHATLTGQKS